MPRDYEGRPLKVDPEEQPHLRCKVTRCRLRALVNGFCGNHDPLVREFKAWLVLGVPAPPAFGPEGHDAPDPRPCQFDRDRATWA